MAYTEDKSQDELDVASLPLAGTELLPIFQGGETKQCTVDDIKNLIAAWKTSGNTGTDDTVDFIGTTDDQDVVFKVQNIETIRLTSSSAQALFNQVNSSALFAAGYAQQFFLDSAGGYFKITSEEDTGHELVNIDVATQSIKIDEDTLGYNINVGTNSPSDCAVLKIVSTNKGLLLPRLTKIQRATIASPESGLMIFQTDNTPGLRVYSTDGHWKKFSESNDD